MTTQLWDPIVQLQKRQLDLQSPVMRLDAKKIASVLCVGIAILLFHDRSSSAQSIRDTVNRVQPAVVKIVGSGGFRGLESYQTGILIADNGYVLTSWSYVLDSDKVMVTLNDGERHDGRLVGYDPRSSIAILKIPGEGFSHFDLENASAPKIGAPILAFSNLFGVASGAESISVQRGVVSGLAKLSGRKGAFAAIYDEAVVIIDAVTNNPGAAGGAITTLDGGLIGLIGREWKDEMTGTWLNFAIPIANLKDSVQQILDGRMVVETKDVDSLPVEPMSLELLGVELVPDVVDRTPPFVDSLDPQGVGKQFGIMPDDLIIEVAGVMTPSVKAVRDRLTKLDRDSRVAILIRRGDQFVTIVFDLVRARK